MPGRARPRAAPDTQFVVEPTADHAVCTDATPLPPVPIPPATMGLRVNTNTFALNAQRNLGRITSRLGRNYARLSSGLRIASAADDAAGLGISERMRSQIRSLGQAGRNALDGISMVQAAESAVGEISSILVRMRELAVQASTGTLNDTDRQILFEEYVEIEDEILRIAEETEFNGISLLDGGADVSIQVGLDSGQAIDVSAVDLTPGTMNLYSTFLDTASNAQDALDVIDVAIDSVNSARGSLGAVQNRLGSAYASVLASREGLSQAESRIRDVDVAAESADLTRNTILQEAAVSVLAQANFQPGLALTLLG